MEKKFIMVMVALMAIATMNAQGNKFDSYKGLVMAGYQGWFNAPTDGAKRGWYHYESRSSFAPGSCTIDFWPEVSEYEKLYPTDFKFADGSTAYVFSSYDDSTVDTHFRWMNEYGLDGVFMQRFVAEIKTKSGKKHFNKVLGSAVAASRKYDRAIAVMYDLSGMWPGDENVLLNDIKELNKKYDLMSREKNPTYLYHNGRPLVTVWGVGFNDRRRYGLDEAEKIVDGLKKMGFSVMLGVPTHWRELTSDTGSDVRLHEIIKKCDIVMPWFVGRYNERTFSPTYTRLVADDIKWTKDNGVDYVPLAFPGFSWRNMPGNENSVPIARRSGDFFWMQLASNIAAGAEMLYIAMFDEIDEGTAIFKCAKHVPVGKSTFVPIDSDIESDHYLWLAGNAARMLRGEIPLQVNQPKRDNLAER
ncbi:MAG: glycoside hydrolase family 71/99-like protein [Muribaculum sp.]|nr:glycoside hydrolase family 71/99-like protein [Muribaculum sp.]